eukprot:5344966-Heterocapsa_arctica.AAC.1
MLRSWRRTLRRHQTHMDGCCNLEDDIAGLGHMRKVFVSGGAGGKASEQRLHVGPILVLALVR